MSKKYVKKPRSNFGDWHKEHKWDIYFNIVLQDVRGSISLDGDKVKENFIQEGSKCLVNVM